MTKLSEKYLASHTLKANFFTDDAAYENPAVLPSNAKTYGEICALEEQISLLESALLVISDARAKSILTAMLNCFIGELKKLEKELG